jgi:hypothetical protein
MTEVTQEQIQSAIMSDKRYALISMAAAVAGELRDSKALHIFMMALRKEAEDALVEFADANIANSHEIMPLQVRVKTIVFLNRTIEELLNAAKNAEDHLMNDESADLNNG